MLVEADGDLPRGHANLLRVGLDQLVQLKFQLVQLVAYLVAVENKWENFRWVRFAYDIHRSQKNTDQCCAARPVQKTSLHA